MLLPLLLHSLLWFVFWEHKFTKHCAAMPRLVRRSPHTPLPSVCVFVPARNEEAAIEDAVRSLLRQDYEGPYHVVVANDHSTDQTGEILARLMAEDTPGRLTVFTPPALPAGWMGKCHALYHAVRHAPFQADYYLFTDADVEHRPDTIRRASAHMQKDNADLLAIPPFVRCESFWENAVLPVLMQLGMNNLNPAHVNDPRKRDIVGIGAFTMLRRTMYEKWGGHEAIRGEVIDDMAMGLMTKRAGGRSVIAASPRQIELRMYSGLGAIVHGFEKNMQAAIGQSFLLTVLISTAFPLLHVVPLVVMLLALATGAFGWALLAAAVHLATGLTLYRRVHGRFMGLKLPMVLAGFPLGACVAMYTMTLSAWHAKIKGQVRWRGRTVELPEQKTKLV